MQKFTRSDMHTNTQLALFDMVQSGKKQVVYQFYPC